MASINPLREWAVDSLKVRVYRDGKVLGQAAAEDVAQILRGAVASKGHAVGVFATGASQFDFMAALRERSDIDWQSVVAFHLDEYIGIGPDHPASFRRYLREQLFDIVKPAEVHYLDGDADDPAAECERYAGLLKDAGPADVACIGIGENGHIAFNDPHVANFDDPVLVKIVDLDEPCRMQQHGEGWFETLEDVPKYAMTQTVPAILSARAISCVVPDRRKAEAVLGTVMGPIETTCPASALRNHEHCALLLDSEAASLLPETL